MARPKYLPDNFTLSLVATVVVASVFPAHGVGATIFGHLTTVAIMLLFFLHGAKLPREALVAAITHWRLHLLILGSTFVMFPLLALGLRPVLSPLVTPALYTGVLFTCMLPSTVQSSIALTSIAKGNVPAAVCAASASSVLGIFITPLLAGVILSTHGSGGASPLQMIGGIVMQLLVPFVAGQIARHWIGAWVTRNKAMLKVVDNSSIILTVYSAFSAAVIEGLWHEIPPAAIGGLVLVNLILLAIALGVTTLVGRRLGFSQADRITIMFCGSKKSLAAGIPMAKVLFAGAVGGAGTVVLPLMLFHQIQLMVCSVLAQRFGARDIALDDGGAMPQSPTPPGR
ncbi:MAG: bile acid:sodium symporter family protein [Janthinobacterium lividum]